MRKLASAISLWPELTVRVYICIVFAVVTMLMAVMILFRNPFPQRLPIPLWSCYVLFLIIAVVSAIYAIQFGRSVRAVLEVPRPVTLPYGTELNPRHPNRWVLAIMGLACMFGGLLELSTGNAEEGLMFLLIGMVFFIPGMAMILWARQLKRDDDFHEV